MKMVTVRTVKMKRYKVSYLYALPAWDEFDKTEHALEVVYADNAEHAYQQFKKLVCTAKNAPLKYWVGGADIKEFNDAPNSMA